MKITRVNEPLCPCCGRGMRSGYPYPDCIHPPIGMGRRDAHRVFCNEANFAPDICAQCKESAR